MDVPQGSEQDQPPVDGTTSAVRPAPSNNRRRTISFDDPAEAAMWTFVAVLILFALFMFVAPAKADVVTEIGGGVKFNMSYLLEPSCRKAIVTQPGWPENPRGETINAPSGEFSCGGDNPVFVGWPIAYQTPNGRFRIGWFHMSHWFDGGEFNFFGGDDAETHFNCLCASWTFNWTEIRRRKK